MFAHFSQGILHLHEAATAKQENKLLKKVAIGFAGEDPPTNYNDLVNYSLLGKALDSCLRRNVMVQKYKSDKNGPALKNCVKKINE